MVEVLPEREFDLWYQDKVAEKIALDQSTKKQAEQNFDRLERGSSLGAMSEVVIQIITTTMTMGPKRAFCVGYTRLTTKI